MYPTPLFQVLILSDENAERSILAEYLLRAKGKGRFGVTSAGLNPRGRVSPLTLLTLEERYGLPATGARSKSWEECRVTEFDFIITTSEKARDSCISWRGQPVRAHWGSPSPEELALTPAGLMQAYIDVASQIAARVNLFVSFPDEKLVSAAWEAGTRFPFRNDYAPIDAERLEWAST